MRQNTMNEEIPQNLIKIKIGQDTAEVFGRKISTRLDVWIQPHDQYQFDQMFKIATEVEAKKLVDEKVEQYFLKLIRKVINGLN